MDFARRHKDCGLEFQTEPLEALQELAHMPFDGVIAVVSTLDLASSLRERGVPVVNSSGTLSPVPFPSVLPDDELAGRMAAEHLMVCGLRQFAFAGDRNAAFSHRRKDGFARAVGEAGLSCQELFLPDDHFGEAHVGELAQWIAELPKPVGLMMDGDGRARWLLDACRVAGAHVPQDVALVGVDNNTPCCTAAVPTISSVDVNHDRIGYEAAALMARLMAGEPPPAEPVIVRPRGVQARQSTNVATARESIVAAASRHMRDHAHEPITSDDIARALAISRHDLDTAYHKWAGRSPEEELASVRLDRARGLAACSSVTFEQIAHQCGYAGEADMEQAFVTVIGISPADYRRRYGSE